MDSNDQAVIDALNDRIARLEADKSGDGGPRQACPSCLRSFPISFVNWPGYLIPGERRCSACYAAENSAE